MTSDKTSITWKIVGGIAAALLLGWTAFNFIQLTAHEKEEYTLDFVDDDVRSLDIKTSNGDVTVVADRESGARVEAKGFRGFWSNHNSETMEPGGVLKIRSHCAGFGVTGCQINYVVHVPVSTLVKARTSNGDIRVDGGNNVIDAHTPNGDVEVTGTTGELRVSSNNGDVDVRDSRSERIKASSDNGDVHTVLLMAPGNVQVDSDNGDVIVELPRTEDRYNTNADTNNGKVRNSVGVDSSSNRIITANSDNGDVTIRYSPTQ